MIAAVNLAKRYGQRTLFEEVSVKFTPGKRYGLIGANGVGKSTFMKILTGQEDSTTGDVAVDKGCRLGYLKQDHYEFENESIIDTVCMGKKELWKLHKEREYLYSGAELNDLEEERANNIEEEFGDAGGYMMEAEAGMLLSGLGFPEDKHYEPMNSLSGGFKLRVLLAQVLYENPDILLLDEPTNHLDMATIDWLCDFLRKSEGTVIVISHNRYFLNEVCTHVADLDRQEMRLFTGNYDDFMVANMAALERIKNVNKKAEKRAEELKDFINRFSANASKAKQATSRQKELEKLQVQEIKASSRVSPYIRFDWKERLGKKVIEMVGVSKTYEETLFKDVNLEIGQDDRIAILGTNGVGKTTLLKLLIKQIEPCNGDIVHGDTVAVSYFPQDPTEVLAMNERAMEWLGHFVDRTELSSEQLLRSTMGKILFRGEDVEKPCKVLSGGEKARLVVGKMILEGGNLLVLDEPTNHLDLESIESLNFALTLVKMPVILVSHDREFVSSIANRIIEIEDGKVIDYPGTLEEFEDWKLRNKKAN